jgi:septum formation protein
MTHEIILGSCSPRRREILGYFSLPFRQLHPSFDEESVPFRGDPVAYVNEIARGKALALAKDYPQEIILTADTTVYANGRVYAKPANLKEAHGMLRELSGQAHSVFTGVCIHTPKQEFLEAEETRVIFNNLTETEIVAYASAIQPLDKAGGYAIQENGGLIVKRIEGCYYNVMGLPLQTVRRGLLNVGIDLWAYLKSGSPV